MKSKTARAAAFFTLALALAVTGNLLSDAKSWADGHDQEGHGHGRRDPGKFIWHVLKAKEALDLSEEQATKLRTLGVTFKKDRVKRDADVELAKIDVHQLLYQQDQQKDSGDVESTIRKLYALKADRRIASFKTFQEVRGLLTPEQLKKLRDMHGQKQCSLHQKRGESHGDNGQHGERAMLGQPTAAQQ
jgi:Spy/CpxP family protein refolding chaperone